MEMMNIPMSPRRRILMRKINQKKLNPGIVSPRRRKLQLKIAQKNQSQVSHVSETSG